MYNIKNNKKVSPVVKPVI